MFFTRIAFITTAATYILLFVGGLVRASGAGLGCPDWPKCFGRWIPPINARQLPLEIDPALFNFTLAWIEYINRLIGVAVGILILLTLVAAIYSYRKVPVILLPTLAAAVLVCLQGILGGKVVASELNPLFVSIHMILALVIVGLLIFVTQTSYQLQADGPEVSRPPPERLQFWLAVLGCLTATQIVVGAGLRSSIELLIQQFPLMPDLELFEHVVGIKYCHIALGLCVAAITAAMVIRHGFSAMVSPSLRRGLVGMLILIIVQIGIGLAFQAVGLKPLMQVFHLWIASTFLGAVLVVYIAVRNQQYGRSLSRVLLVRLAAAAFSIVILFAAAALLIIHRADTSRAVGPKYAAVPEFFFVNQHNEPFAVSALKGKVSVVDFFFTSCPSMCPAMNAKMRELYNYYTGFDGLQFVSISVDPERDTVPVLRTYAERFGVTDRRWHFIRGTVDEVTSLCEDGFSLGGEFPVAHSQKFVLVDAEGTIRGYYSSTDDASLELLKLHIRDLAREP